MEYTSKELQAFAEWASTMYDQVIAAHAEPIANKIRLVTPGNVEVGSIYRVDTGYNLVLSFLPNQVEPQSVEMPEPQRETYTPQVNSPVSPYGEEAYGKDSRQYENEQRKEFFGDTVVDPKAEALKAESEAFERELNNVVGEDKPPVVGGETPDIIPPAAPTEVPQQGAGPQIGYGPRRIG